ncbi:MAG TPA: 30S ribosomal protein S5 [bacterium]|nr:30S ribosomal protein S5 [bacterium]
MLLRHLNPDETPGAPVEEAPLEADSPAAPVPFSSDQPWDFTGEAADGGPREFEEKIIHINRVAKVVKGGRRFGFTALVCIGDKHGTIGVGYGKANEVAGAIKKGVDQAKKHTIKVPVSGGTIPHEITARFGAADILIKPAPPGTGVIAGGPMRAILEAAGYQNVVAKSLGTKNQINVAKATFKALQMLKDPQAYMAARRRQPENYA